MFVACFVYWYLYDILVLVADCGVQSLQSFIVIFIHHTMTVVSVYTATI